MEELAIDGQNQGVQPKYYMGPFVRPGEPGVASVDQQFAHLWQSLCGLLGEIVAAVRNRISPPLDRRDISVIIAEEKAGFVALLNEVDTAGSAEEFNGKVARVQKRLNSINREFLTDAQLKIICGSVDNEMGFNKKQVKSMYKELRDVVQVLLNEKVRDMQDEISCK